MRKKREPPEPVITVVGDLVPSDLLIEMLADLLLAESEPEETASAVEENAQ